MPKNTFNAPGLSMFNVSRRTRQFTKHWAAPIFPERFEAVTNILHVERANPPTLLRPFQRISPPIISPSNGSPQTEELYIARRSFSSQSHATAPKRAISLPPDPSEPKASKLKDKTQPITDHELFFVHCAIEKRGDLQFLIPMTADKRHLPITKLAVVNLMMQGKERPAKGDANLKGTLKHEENRSTFNNAYKLVETKEQYLARIEILIERLSNLISKDGNIDMLFLQEAPIDSDIEFVRNCFHNYLPKEFEVDLSGTSWGVMVVANKAKFPEALSHLTVSNEGPMKDRLARVHLPSFHAGITTLHVPHNDTDQSGVKLIEAGLSESMKTHIANDCMAFTEFFVGDWNSSKDILNIPTRAAEQVLPTSTNIMFSCDTLFTSSPGGHTDADKSKKTVDHMLASTFTFPNEAALKAAQEVIAAQDKKVVPTFHS